MQSDMKAAAADKRWTVTLLVVAGLIVVAYLLLWSAWWSPSSDGSLFISIARNLDEGRGYTYMGRPHRLVTPLTPMMLWGLMQFSRSFSLMNLSMIACMLGSLAFMYLTLKEWLDRRTALCLTAVSALTYWQFRLATLILSDQPFLLLFWLAMYLLVLARRRPYRRGVWLALATAALLLGVGFRIAGVLLAPVIAMGLCFDYVGMMSPWRRALLAGAVAAPLLLAGGAYWAWQPGKSSMDQRPREFVPVPAPAATVTPTSLPATAAVRKEITSYVFRLRILDTEMYLWPAVLGRWLVEAVVAPSREAFVRLSTAGQAILGTLLAVIAAIGLWEQVRVRRWWLVVPIVYVLAFVVLWGVRYIPRYMVPVMPMIVLWFSCGAGAILERVSSWLQGGRSTGAARRAGLVVVSATILLCNLPILAAEVYVCHSGDYYRHLRQGAVAELLDAAGYIRRCLPQDEIVCTNDSIRRREVHLLTGRPVAVFDSVSIADPADDWAVRRFFRLTGARCALIRYKARTYPEWHFSLGSQVRGDWSWWGLYVWDKKSKRPVRVKLPVDRDWSLSLPQAGI